MAKKKIITVEQIEKIRQAAESVKGTVEYNKYNMCCESKRRVNDKWSGWKFITWGVPVLAEYTLKIIKDKMYIVSEEKESWWGTISVDRYEVTDAIKELLEI